MMITKRKNEKLNLHTNMNKYVEEKYAFEEIIMEIRIIYLKAEEKSY